MHSARLTRITAPATEPVTLEEAKLYLRIDHAAEDTLISKLIKAARAVAEEHLRRSLITQRWRLSIDSATASYLALRRGPVQQINQVALVNDEGEQEVLSEDQYRLTAAQDAVGLLYRAPHPRVEIEYQAGYGAAQDVPEPIRQGILQHVCALYEDRDGEVMPAAVLSLYAPYRELRL